MRKLGGSSKKSTSKYDDTEDDNELSRGDRVEARYRGKSKWYKGKIMRVNSDGTYDMEYDDGDVERRVRKSLVRKLGGSSKKSTSKYDDTDDDNELSRDDRVEARYRGKSKWYRARLCASTRMVHMISNTTMATERVRKSLVRKLEVHQRNRHQNTMTLKMIMSFRVAIASKRDIRGKSKWYKGKIMRVNSDGTYDIEYDDGDVERRVRKSLVRKLGGSSKKSTSKYDDTEDDNEHSAWRSK